MSTAHAMQYLADHLKPASKVECLVVHQPASWVSCCSSASQHQPIIPRSRLNTYGRRAFDCWPDGLEKLLAEELRNPAHCFNIFRQFIETILFSW